MNTQHYKSVFNDYLKRAILPISLIILITWFAGNASAQVYKCTSVDSKTQQNKTVYTDVPCAKSAKQFLTNIQPRARLPANQQSSLANTAQSDSNAALDKAVTHALLDKNFALAQSLAQTKEHWRLIAIAQKNSAPEIASVNSYNNQNAQLNACAAEKNDYALAARVDWRDDALIAIKKDEMDAICGGGLPVQSSVVSMGQIYSYPYGGIGAPRWRGANYYHGMRPNNQYGHRSDERETSPHSNQTKPIQVQPDNKSGHATTFYKRN